MAARYTGLERTAAGALTRPRAWLRPEAAVLGLIFVVAVLLRLCLVPRFPALLTNDSWDYVRAAESIYHRADFSGDALRDVRMPAYPVFLAVTQPLTGLISIRLVLLQKALGLFSVLLGFAVGLKLRSWWIAGALGVFLGLSPAFLLFEHTVMPDTLFLFLLQSLILCTLWSLEGALSWYKAVAVGIAAGLCVLTRPGALLLCAVLILGIAAVRLARDRAPFAPTGSLWAAGRFLAVASAAICLVVGPWLWRNDALFGKATLVNFHSRNLLIYKAMHGNLDLSLPSIAHVNEALSAGDVPYLDYGWLQKLSSTYPPNEAERIARALVWEQITHHPADQLADTWETFWSFGGVSPTPGNDRFALRFWFTYLVPDAALVEQVNTPPWGSWEGADFVYVPAGSDRFVTDWWSRAGVFYLDWVRPALFFAFFLLLGFVAVCGGRDRQVVAIDARLYTALLCGAAYLATVLAHSLTLTDNDRYMASLELLSFLTSVTIIAYARDAWRRVRANAI